MSETTTKKRKASLPILIAGGVSSLVLALGMSPTFSAFTASITNSGNTAGSGTLIMQQTDSSGLFVCSSADATTLATNSATCSNNVGNISMVPGQTVTTLVNIKNTGTVNASSFSLTSGACAQSANGNTSTAAPDLCSKINIVVMSGTHEIFKGTAATFASSVIDVKTKLGGSPIVAQASATPFVFAVTLDSSATNAYQGLKISMPITWAFGA